MPYSPSDGRFPHLTLVQEVLSPERRTRRGRSGVAPNRGSREFFGAELARTIQTVADDLVTHQTHVPGIQPHLVFRVPLAHGAPTDKVADRLGDAGLTVVSVEPEGAVIAFREDSDLRSFHEALEEYRAGPREGINPRTQKPYLTTQWDIFEFIDAESMAGWSRRDRIGQRLQLDVGRDGEGIERSSLYIVDVELWYRGTRTLAQTAIDEIQALQQYNPLPDERILDRFIGDYICLAKVAIRGENLDQLLSMSIVANVDLPPIPVFDAYQVNRVTPRSFPKPIAPDPDGPRLCILDSGIVSSHPLLAANVGHEEAILTTLTSPSDLHGHGTRVGGIAVFGDVKESYLKGVFASPITLYSGRVLNDQNHFDDERLIINQMREAIEYFSSAPFNCRVFNLSLGSVTSAFEAGSDRQTLWAESLDIIARSHRVLLVVASGNIRGILTSNTEAAEEIVARYPRLLFDPPARLSDPATSAIALTVGSLADSDTIAVRHGSATHDIARPLAARNRVSPFSRTGPGVNGAIKPEFVDYGGNAVFVGFGSNRRIAQDAGTSIMSFSHEPLTSLFSFDVGSSYAAPRVARKAAIVWHRLESLLGIDVHPNLVRALLASASSVPSETCQPLEGVDGKQSIFNACGYGLIDEELALASSERRVTMIHQGSIQVDHFQVFQIPAPTEFCQAPGTKRITMTLAFDPPVRRRRADYLGIEMSFNLVRGKTAAEVIEAYRKAPPGPTRPDKLESRFVMTLDPPSNPTSANFNRKKSTLQKASAKFKIARDEYGDTYFLVVRCERKWASAAIQYQDYAVTVTLEADEARLYNLVEQRIRQRVRQRA